jgi:hypothetical protein
MTKDVAGAVEKRRANSASGGRNAGPLEQVTDRIRLALPSTDQP